MKALNVMFKDEENTYQGLRLFTKLKEMKQKRPSIQGIPVIESECSEDDDEYLQINTIKKQLEHFKEKKAREVAKIHAMTKESIESIVLAIKQELQYEALCIINPKIQNSVQHKTQDTKDFGSTLPGSAQSKHNIDTPGFDLSSGRPKTGEVMDMREFTLGQREQSSSQRPYWQAIGGEVSQFQLPVREPSSKRIKDKIMNSNRNTNK